MYVIALQGWVETKWEKTKYIEKKNLGHFCAFITSESDSKCRKQYRVAHGLAACLPDRKTWASVCSHPRGSNIMFPSHGVT